MTYLLIGLIVGSLFVVLAFALCKMSARCSPAEQAAMDDEQAEAMAGWRYERQAVRGKAKWNARMARRDGE